MRVTSFSASRDGSLKDVDRERPYPWQPTDQQAAGRSSRVADEFPGLAGYQLEGSSGGAGASTDGRSVPPSTCNSLPVTQEDASEAK